MSSEIQPTRELEQITVKSDTRDVLAHAAKEVETKGFDKFLIVDVDAHVTETAFWSEIVERIDSDVYQQMAKYYEGVEKANLPLLDEVFHQQWAMRDDDVPEGVLDLVLDRSGHAGRH